MTPDERQMIAGLFDRMRQQGAGVKDRDAESFIRDAVRQMPDAPYMMVQSILVQEMALQQSEERMRELEDRIQDLESRAQPQPQQSSGSFLGGLFGGSKPAASTSVPVSGRQQSGGFASAPRPAGGSPWGNAPQQGGYAPQAQQGYAQPPMQQQPAGGGFMRSAMTTAAGVAGGMLAANAISNMMNGGHSAHAATGASDAHKSAATENAPANQQVAAAEDNDPGTYDDNDPGYEAGGNDDAGGGWDE